MRSIWKKYFGLGLSIAALGGWQACGTEDHGAENPQADACEHLQHGPAAEVTASADSTGGLPSIEAGHTRFDVTLPGTAGALRGFARLAPDEEGDLLVALGKDVPFVLLDSAGAAVGPEKKETSGLLCPELKAAYTFEVTAGNYVMAFGPTAEAEVGVVLVETGSHGH